VKTPAQGRNRRIARVAALTLIAASMSIPASPVAAAPGNCTTTPYPPTYVSGPNYINHYSATSCPDSSVSGIGSALRRQGTLSWATLDSKYKNYPLPGVNSANISGQGACNGTTSTYRVRATGESYTQGGVILDSDSRSITCR
jgi:hypothetical protein